METVAILGASEKPDRFANKAFHMLQEYGHTTVLVSPRLKELEGQKVFSSLQEIKTPIDTLTMYVNADLSNKLKTDILNLKPKRVIFNPGSENLALEKDLKAAGIKTVQACTLVLLRTNQF